jgi:hypothetical protein
MPLPLARAAPGRRRSPKRRGGGSGFLVAVSTESLPALGASCAHAQRAEWLAIASFVLFPAGLAAYGWVGATLDLRYSAAARVTNGSAAARSRSPRSPARSRPTPPGRLHRSAGFGRRSGTLRSGSGSPRRRGCPCSRSTSSGPRGCATTSGGGRPSSRRGCTRFRAQRSDGPCRCRCSYRSLACGSGSRWLCGSRSRSPASSVRARSPSHGDGFRGGPRSGRPRPLPGGCRLRPS